MSEDDILIMDLFRGRCVCGRKAVTIHEIEPRSTGKSAMRIDNRIPLCADCHNWVHRVGTKFSAEILHDVWELNVERY